MIGNVVLPTGEGGIVLVAEGSLSLSEGALIVGRDGADSITGSAGPDILIGGAGNDQLDSGGGGGDKIDGGAGLDRLLLDRLNLTAAVALTLDGRGFGLPDGTSVAGVELVDLKTGAGADRVTFIPKVAGMQSFDGGAGLDTATLYFRPVRWRGAEQRRLYRERRSVPARSEPCWRPSPSLAGRPATR